MPLPFASTIRQPAEADDEETRGGGDFCFEYYLLLSNNMKLQVLYEDNHLIAVFKPAGVLTQGDKSGDVNLLDEVKKYLKEKYKKPGNVFLGLLHRLDRNVSGIVLFAKTSKGASRLSEQFRERSVEKIYHAIVLGRPKQKKANLINYLNKDESKNKVAISREKKSGFELVELSFETISSNNKYSLLKIKLETGKPHQIRAQLSFLGFPILGDKKYGAPFALPDNQLGLCATSIVFKSVVGNERKSISIPFPKEWKEYLN
ncbi:MAG: RNA pseudouridine synthase [Candidatus Nealsonbacteria bacterium]|nr:RNA pseudouridine synthase [Candidatus Nealsonbacteria bacterium]